MCVCVCMCVCPPKKKQQQKNKQTNCFWELLSSVTNVDFLRFKLPFHGIGLQQQLMTKCFCCTEVFRPQQNRQHQGAQQQHAKCMCCTFYFFDKSFATDFFPLHKCQDLPRSPRSTRTSVSSVADAKLKTYRNIETNTSGLCGEWCDETDDAYSPPWRRCEPQLLHQLVHTVTRSHCHRCSRPSVTLCP